MSNIHNPPHNPIQPEPNPFPCPRPMTEGEKATYKNVPALNPAQCTVLHPATRDYNCIAWSLGYTDRWINTGTKSQLEDLYLKYYYVLCDASTADIDAYAVGERPEHASRRETATNFSSKMGKGIVLEHPRLALVDSSPKAMYGVIYEHFQKHPSHPGNDHSTMPKPDHPDKQPFPTKLPVGHPEGPAPIPQTQRPIPTTSTHPTTTTSAHPTPTTTTSAHPTPTTTTSAHPTPTTTTSTHPTTTTSTHPTTTTSTHPTTTTSTHPTTTTSNKKPPPHGVSKEVLKPMDAFDPIPPPADEAIASIDQLHDNLSTAYPDAAANFDQLYDAWKKTWDDEDKQFSSNSQDFAQGPEFDALVGLGPATIPFVLKKIASPGEFFAVDLYNALEKDAGVKVDEDNVLDKLILQRHANLLVDMNHQRNETFNNMVKEWKDHQEAVHFSSHSEDHIDSEAFSTIVAMGQSVIGHAMEAYSKEPDGWWHEALHQIVHGEPSGSNTFFKDKLFGDWKKWFESGKAAEDAPKAS